MDTTLTIIIAVAVLYNFGKRQGDELPEKTEEVLPGENAEDGQTGRDTHTPPEPAKRPEFCLLVEPPVGLLSLSLVLDLGEDRLVLNARPSLFHLDCFTPFFIDQEGSVAQYNTNTQILTVTMPVVSS
ncbi:unnamed protein product [Coregonus sp. 'balchen']|nr:unnamed protein product [Coregonus sp. 'balchen']